jgi:Tfp pilus assembly protein FimV
VAPEADSAPGAAAAPDARQPPLSSATLADIYLQQGLLGRAVEVLRQVLEEEPGNDTVRARLAEIETLARDSAGDHSVPEPDDGDERAARRRALERTIERLESLLAVVRRGR